MIARGVALSAALLLGACSSLPPPASPADAVAQVRAAETAFARTMADRNFDAFAAHIADDAVFVNGGKPLRGKAAILEHWKRFFQGPTAPFAWQPQIVEVAAAGELGYSEGPVSSPQGKVVARYYSTWRRSSTGRWLIVFDNGYDVCDCPK